MFTHEVFPGPVFMDFLWFLVLWSLFSLIRVLIDHLGHLPAASHSVPPKVDEAITTPGSFSLPGSQDRLLKAAMAKTCHNQQRIWANIGTIKSRLELRKAEMRLLMVNMMRIRLEMDKKCLEMEKKCLSSEGLVQKPPAICSSHPRGGGSKSRYSARYRIAYISPSHTVLHVTSTTPPASPSEVTSVTTSSPPPSEYFSIASPPIHPGSTDVGPSVTPCELEAGPYATPYELEAVAPSPTPSQVTNPKPSLCLYRAAQPSNPKDSHYKILAFNELSLPIPVPLHTYPLHLPRPIALQIERDEADVYDLCMALYQVRTEAIRYHSGCGRHDRRLAMQMVSEVGKLAEKMERVRADMRGMW